MNNSERAEGQYEFAWMVRHLVRLRHHQGEEVVEAALREAAGLDWRFCANCGTEEPCEGDVCSACGR